MNFPRAIAAICSSCRVPRRVPLIKGAALVSSLILAGAFTGESINVRYGLWLGWVALIPLFIAIRSLTPSLAAGCGALWGLCAFLNASFAGESFAASWPIAAMVLTSAPAAYAWVCAHAMKRRGFDPLILGLGWAAVELVMHPIGLHHGLLAATQESNWLLFLVGRMGGYVVVAFLVAFIGAAVFGVVTEAVCVGGSSRRRSYQTSGVGLRVRATRWLPFFTRYLTPSQPRAPPRVA